MRTGTPKDVLSRLKWKDGVEDWGAVRLVIRHRGAPSDEAEIAGNRITQLGTRFFEVDGETSIPYHRILRIYLGNALVYERNASSAMRSR